MNCQDTAPRASPHERPVSFFSRSASSLLATKASWRFADFEVSAASSCRLSSLFLENLLDARVSSCWRAITEASAVSLSTRSADNFPSKSCNFHTSCWQIIEPMPLNLVSRADGSDKLRLLWLCTIWSKATRLRIVHYMASSAEPRACFFTGVKYSTLQANYLCIQQD